jgi:hypothetical protein
MLSWIIGTVVAVGTGCNPYQRLPADPGTSFAAHIVKGGLMVDEMRGADQTALVTSTHLLRLFDEPTLVVQRGPSRGEGIWLNGPGRAVVRTSEAPDAALVGRVEPFWDDKAIRLLIEPAGAAPLWSDVFEREPGWGHSELTRRVEHEDELYGAYRAVLRSRDGTPTGWFQMKIGDEQPCPVMYEAVLPPEIDEGLAAASAAALGNEYKWIDGHTLEATPGLNGNRG